MAARVRRFVALVCQLAAAIVVAAPMLLGPALSPLLRATHNEAHLCACGMAAGTCGCPECDRLEAQRHEDETPGPNPVIRSSCDDDESPLPSTAQPPSVLAAAFALRDDAPGDVLPIAPLAPLTSLENDGPPTPPPRHRSL
jgi:hypothetical protein